MIGKNDFKFYKKGSIVPRTIVDAKNKIRRKFRFDNDVYIVGNKQIFVCTPSHYIIKADGIRNQDNIIFYKVDFINISGIQWKSPILLLNTGRKPIGVIILNDIENKSAWS